MKNHILSIIVILLFISAALSGETVLSSLDDIAAYGTEHNLEYKNSLVSVMKAEDDRSGLLLLKNTSISAEADIFKNISGTSTKSEGLGITSTLTVPVLDQISLSASVNDSLSGQVGIILNPLSHSSTWKEEELKYNSSIISAGGKMISAQIDAIGSALNWMLASREISAAVKDAELSEIQYNDDRVRYDLGEITLDELNESFISWSEARVLLSTEEEQYRASESSLYSSLGGGSSDVLVEILELDELEDSLVLLKNSLDPQSGDPLKISSYLVSVLDVQSAELNLKQTWAYEPDLKASAGLSFDSSGNLSVEAALQFSISPDDFQVRKREIAKEEYRISLSEAEQSLNQAELDFEQTIDSITSSAINSDISRLEMEQAGILLLEAELLFKLGEYSEVELNESRLTVVKAENSLFRALTDEYLSWLELKRNI